MITKIKETASNLIQGIQPRKKVRDFKELDPTILSQEPEKDVVSKPENEEPYYCRLDVKCRQCEVDMVLGLVMRLNAKGIENKMWQMTKKEKEDEDSEAVRRDATSFLKR